MEKIKTLAENTESESEVIVPVSEESPVVIETPSVATETTTTTKKKSTKKSVVTPISSLGTSAELMTISAPQAGKEAAKSPKQLPEKYTLADYLILLAMTGHKAKDIISMYAFFQEEDYKTRQENIKKYYSNIGAFFTDKKLITSEIDAKLINNMFCKTFRDAVVNLCITEYGMTYENINEILQLIRKGFTEVSKKLGSFVEDKVLDTSDESSEITQDDDKILSLTGGDTPVEKPLKISAQNAVVLNDVTAKNASISVKGTNSATVNNFKTEGEVLKDTCHNQLYVDSDKAISINGGSFEAKGYNVIESGFETEAPLPETIDIKGVKITGEISNNAILIAGLKDNAVVNISDCEVEQCSNFLRYSNKNNVSGVTINIKDCVIHQWETESENERGMIDLEDYTSSADAEVSNNLFGPEKLTINVINCTGPDGKKIVVNDIAEVCGTKDEKQLVFLYRHGSKSFPEYNKENWPVINFK